MDDHNSGYITKLDRRAPKSLKKKKRKCYLGWTRVGKKKKRKKPFLGGNK
jgi:hypothetical protein